LFAFDVVRFYIVGALTPFCLSVFSKKVGEMKYDIRHI